MQQLSNCEVARQTRGKAIALEIITVVLMLVHVPGALSLFSGNFGGLFDLVLIGLLMIGWFGAFRRSPKLLMTHFVIQTIFLVLYVVALLILFAFVVVALVVVAANAGQQNSDPGYPTDNSLRQAILSQNILLSTMPHPLQKTFQLAARHASLLVAAVPSTYDESGMATNEPAQQINPAGIILIVGLVVILFSIIAMILFSLQTASVVLSYKLRKHILRVQPAISAATDINSTEMPMVSPNGYMPLGAQASAASSPMVYTIAAAPVAPQLLQNQMQAQPMAPAGAFYQPAFYPAFAPAQARGGVQNV